MGEDQGGSTNLALSFIGLGMFISYLARHVQEAVRYKNLKLTFSRLRDDVEFINMTSI